MTVNTLYANPLWIPATRTYDRIGVSVSSFTAGGMRMGIYSDNAGLPGALVLDAGAVAKAGGNLLITISQTLTGPAKYWLAVDTDTACTLNTAAGVLGIMLANSTPGAGLGSVVRAFTYGAFPDPFGTVTSIAAHGMATLRAA